QAVILLVRPFDEGNERLARMLSYMILMRNGYSFFRQFALSGMIAQDGILYYKAMDTVQDVRGEGDLTCFLEYYLGMLSRSVSGFEAYIAQKHRSKMEEKQPEENKPPHQPIAIHPVVEERDTPLPSRKKTPEIASRQKTIQSIDGIEKCTTPETIIAYITTQQGKQLRIIDTKPHLHRLGITEEDILRAMQESQSEFSQRALSVIRMLREDPTRMFSCRDIELTLGIKIGTVRQTCYTLASLNLIQTTQVRGHGNGHESHRYFCKKALAA
ncbi:MAG: hypothetical protein GX567_19340, partial [Clostridia bacterium]|nr:hypothetical protein [Clostridia bacterium]